MSKNYETILCLLVHNTSFHQILKGIYDPKPVKNHCKLWSWKFRKEHYPYMQHQAKPPGEHKQKLNGISDATEMAQTNKG